MLLCFISTSLKQLFFSSFSKFDNFQVEHIKLQVFV